jgi:hypothetical protein
VKLVVFPTYQGLIAVFARRARGNIDVVVKLVLAESVADLARLSLSSGLFQHRAQFLTYC